jgi:hypothetical protein
MMPTRWFLDDVSVVAIMCHASLIFPALHGMVSLQLSLHDSYSMQSAWHAPQQQCDAHKVWRRAAVFAGPPLLHLCHISHSSFDHVHGATYGRDHRVMLRATVAGEYGSEAAITSTVQWRNVLVARALPCAWNHTLRRIQRSEAS